MSSAFGNSNTWPIAFWPLVMLRRLPIAGPGRPAGGLFERQGPGKSLELACRADQLHTMMDQDVRQVLQNVPEARQADEAMQAYLSSLPSGARSVVAGLISAQAEAGYLSGLLDKNINDVLAGDRRLAEANGALRAYIGAQHGALHDRLMEVVSGQYAAYFAAGKIRSNPSLAGGGPQYVPIPVPDMSFVDPAPAIPTPSMPRPCFGFVDPGASYAGATCY